MSVALDILIFASGYAHVLLAPYTKVEESFNLHATHDVLMYGVKPSNLHKYDHFVFSGVVPRTFLGSALLAWLVTPILHLVNLSGYSPAKSGIQIISRLVLSTLNALSLCLLRRAVSIRFGRPTSMWYTLLSISQFHVPFWMGRTLPNMFALFPVNLASFFLISRPPSSSKPPLRNFNLVICLLVFTSVIFRAEISLLLAPIALQGLVLRWTNLQNLLKVGVVSGIVSLLLTVSVDSYFWNRWPLWPEFSGIYFNVIQGKSSEWGTSPPLTYFSTHLPKLLLTSLPLALLASVISPRIRSLMLPVGIFIGLISCLGHKEWRFVVYAVPMVNVAGGWGLRWMVSRNKGSLFGRLTFLAAVGCILANFLVTILLTRSSMANYPGGEALALMNRKYAGKDHVHVHISNLAAQTGASLFLQINSPPYADIDALASRSSSRWTYNKTESLSPSTLTSSPQFTHLIVESDADVQFFKMSGKWKLVDSVWAFEGWKMPTAQEVKRIGQAMAELDVWDLMPKMEKREKLWIMERTGWAR